MKRTDFIIENLSNSCVNFYIASVDKIDTGKRNIVYNTHNYLFLIHVFDI